MGKIIHIDNCTLINGDCLELMKDIPEGSIDLVLTDPPYGTVKGLSIGWGDNATFWDNTLDVNKMMSLCSDLLRYNGCMALFSQEPYTSNLITNNTNNLPFSYRYIWLKNHFANPLSCSKAPVNYTEDICIFFKKHDNLNKHPLRSYFNRLLKKHNLTKSKVNKDLGHQKIDHTLRVNSPQFTLCTEEVYNQFMSFYEIEGKPYSELKSIDSTFKRTFNLWNGGKIKSDVLNYSKESLRYHPTQKPILLLEDLIKTYTNEGDTVLDFTAGSFSTAIACINTNRKFIGIELDENYFNVGVNRIEDHIRYINSRLFK